MLKLHYVRQLERYQNNSSMGNTRLRVGYLEIYIHIRPHHFEPQPVDDTRAGTPSSKIPHHTNVRVSIQYSSLESGYEPGTLWPQHFSCIKIHFIQ